MTKHQHKYAPGPVFQDAFLAGMWAVGMSSRKFAEKHGLKVQNLRSYTTGMTNGPKALKVRELMIAEIGPDLFEQLYRRRLKAEDAA